MCLNRFLDMVFVTFVRRHVIVVVVLKTATSFFVEKKIRFVVVVDIVVHL